MRILGIQLACMKRMHSIACLATAAITSLLCAVPAHAVNVAVVGLFTNKAVVQIDGGPPRTLSTNQKTAEGITLLAVERDSAVFDIGGRRQTLKMGQAHSTSSASSRASVTLAANPQGHFITDGQINGASVRFVVDTGATLISMSSADANRIGIKYRDAPTGTVSTANGMATAWRVKLDTVRIGDISLNGIEALIMENQNMPVLLGMSFLNRMEMKRDGESMVLTKRF